MIFSDEHKFVYIRVPKVGSTSLFSFFRTFLGKKGLRKYDRDTHRVEIPDYHENYFKFCFVRNPYTRMVYFWLSDSFQRGTSLGFIDWMERIGMCGKRNWACQSDYIDMINFPPDKVFRFENRIEELQRGAEFLQPVNCDWNLLRKDYSWVDSVAKVVLLPEAKEMIKDHSKKDFERFNYPLEYPF
jgi:hypothetical protein